MPRQKRWALKRECDRVIEDIERAQAHLVAVYEAFAAPHPEYAQQLYVMGQALGSVSQVIGQFRDEVI